MENPDKEIKDLGNQRREHSLSLRKKKINEHILKRRLGLNNKNYSINKEEIIVKEEYKNKQFKGLADLLNFTSIILGNDQSDKNDIKFAIWLLKATEIKNDKGEVNNSNIMKELSKALSKYINDIIVVDEIITILINFSYYLTIETNMNLLTNEYLNIYSKITTLYFKDDIIFHDLIILLGNLAHDNITAQKIFYQTKLFEEIFNLVQNEKAPKDKKDVCLWFLAIFTKGIQNNIYFINNTKLLKCLIDIMIFYAKQEEYIVYCLEAIGNLSDIESMSEYLVGQNDFFNFIFEINKPELYLQINKILVSIASFNEKINLILVENYKVILYMLKLLNSSSIKLQGQVLFLLGNILENESSKINEIIYNHGIFDIIFKNLESPNVDILSKSLFLVNVIVNSLNNEGIFRLYQKNIHIKLINILKTDYNRDIIDMTIDAIIEFLQKDSQDGVIKQSFIDNGLKEVFSNMILDRNDTEIFFKTEQIRQIYF